MTASLYQSGSSAGSFRKRGSSAMGGILGRLYAQDMRRHVRVELNEVVGSAPGEDCVGQQIAHLEGAVMGQPERLERQFEPAALAVSRVQIHYGNDHVRKILRVFRVS